MLVQRVRAQVPLTRAHATRRSHCLHTHQKKKNTHGQTAQIGAQGAKPWLLPRRYFWYSMVATALADERVVQKLRRKLEEGRCTLPEKYRILFSLRNCSNASAQDALEVALQDPSALFRHDVAFALGQRQDSASVGLLTRIVHDTNEHPMVRHEAAEALGAIATADCMAPLLAHENDSVREVAETCQLARQRLEYNAARQDGESGCSESKFLSVDPTPPFPADTPLEVLERTMLDENSLMFDRYRSLFALRNRGGAEATAAMAKCFSTASSALLKHEVAYVLGQMLDPKSVECLMAVLKDASEHSMVRHEAAETLGAIGDQDCIHILEEYSSCSDPIVADSCIVALDMIAFEKSGGFEYADMGAE